MAKTEQIIIDVEFNVGETEAKLGSVTKKIEDLKEANKRLKNERKSDSADWASLTAQIKSNEQEIKSLTVAEKDLSGMISVADKQRRKYSDSFRGQAAQLADLKNQYQSLTKAERESAGGKEMFNHLVQLDKQVKENDETMGNFQRNVGNYPQAFDLSGTAVGRFGAMLQGLGGTSTSVGGVVGNAFSGMKAQVVTLGKAFLTPPVAIIAIVLGAIVLAVTKVVDAFKKNDEASTKMEQAFSRLKPISEAVSWVFDKLAVVISNIVLGASKLFEAVMSIIPAYKASAKAADELVVSQDNLEASERRYTVNSAKRNLEIAKIKKEAVNTQKYSSKEIEAMLKKADDLEVKNLIENKNNLATKYNNLVKFYKQEKNTSDEAENAKAAALAAYYAAEESYYSGTLRLASKTNAAKKQQEADALEFNKKQTEERKKKDEELAAWRSKQTEAEIKAFEEAQKAKADALKAFNDLSFAIEDEQAVDLGDAKKYQQDIENAKKTISETSAIENLAFQQSILDKEFQQSIENAKKIGVSTTLIEEAYSEQKKKLNADEMQAKLSLASDFAGNLASVFGESTKVGKAAAAAQIAIDTYKGAMAAYTSLAGVPIVGQALGIAAAAAVSIKGAKAIKDVMSVKEDMPRPRFADGGIVPGTSYSGDNILARVNSSEMILNTEQQKRLFGMIAGSGQSFSSGIDYELLAKAMSKQPAPVVVYKEFANFGEKIAIFDEQTKI